jgi:hypothetical protein
LKALEDMALHTPATEAERKAQIAAQEALAAAAAAAAADGGTESEQAARKKNKLRSMIKGVGSYLGLRKSKKKRIAEQQAAAAAAAAGGGGGGASAAAAPAAPENTGVFKRLLFRSRSSPALQGEDERLGGGSSSWMPGSPRTPASARGLGAASSQSYDGQPNRDENGMYLPNHRRDTPVKGIIKSPRPGTAPHASSHPHHGPPPPAGGGKRRISFVDLAHGAPLERVHFCEDLHYSENSEHEDWDEGDDAGKCTVM